MIWRPPRPVEALIAVPLTVVSSMAYCTWEVCAGVSTVRVRTTGVCTAWSGSCHDLMMWPWWNTPLSSMVASIWVCSLTVSDDSPRRDRRHLVEVWVSPEARMSTPKFCAI